jgi:hypothetical protein
MQEETTSIETLVERAKEGNQQALESVLRSIQDRVYNLALRMLQVPADAEGAAQEILVKVVTHLSEFRGESAFFTWVYRIATLRYLSRVGVLFASIYAAISTSLYIVMLVLVYILAQGGSTAAIYWPLWSLGFPTLSHLSYAIFGVGAIMISVGLTRGRGVRRWGGWSLFVTGAIFILAFPAQVIIGFESALLMLWVGGLAAISFAVAMIVYVRRLNVEQVESRHNNTR